MLQREPFGPPARGVRRVVTPASPIGDEVLAAGLEVARALGLDCEVEVARAGPTSYLAGTDEQRAATLSRALRDCGQVWMARGGYGSGRLATLGAALREETSTVGDGLREAWCGSLWGFSDGTALLSRALAWGKAAWSAPPVSQLPRLDLDSRARLVAAMTVGTVAPFSGLEVVEVEGVRPGREVRGRLFVANLAVLASLAGTPLMPSLLGALLVVEDVNEPAFRVDRFFWQLMAAGALEGVVGLVAGEFTGVDEREREAIGLVLREVGEALRVPVCLGLPVGHGERNACLPIGVEARLGGGRLEVMARADVV